MTAAEIKEINDPGYTKKMVSKQKHQNTCAKNRRKRKRKSKL